MASKFLTSFVEFSASKLVLKNNASNTEKKTDAEKLQDTASPVVNVTVNISDEAKQALKPTDTLFIYVKAENGPPMPLAVAKQTVSSWPVSVRTRAATI